jgi:hypothetical protein
MRLWRINRLFEENEFWGEKNIYAPTPFDIKIQLPFP